MKNIVAQNLGGHRFAFYYDYDQTIVEFCRWLKITYGHMNFSFYGFDGVKAWIFSYPEIIVAIKKNFPDVQMDLVVDAEYKQEVVRLEAEKQREAKAMELKEAVDSDIKINELKLPLYPYQKVGVEFFVNNNGRAILADQMGTGKTATSLAYTVYKKYKKVLVICPASVKFAWKDEVEKWTNLRARVIDSKDTLKVFGENANIFIINYDIVQKFKDELVKVRWESLICDEFHMIKNSRAKRTKAVKDVAKSIPSCLLLSGTPLLNKPIELFNGLNLMDPKAWSNYNNFAIRYCGGHYGRWGLETGGATNLDELQQRIQKYFLRRTKDQILKELPPKRFINIPVELDDKTQKEYDLLSLSLKKYLMKSKKKKEAEADKAMQSEHLVTLGHMRQLTTRGKIEAAQELIENIVEGGEKVVVFCNYNEPLAELYGKFIGQSVMLTGQTPIEDRREIVRRFQEDPGTRIFFGGIRSAGVGITLTAGTVVVTIDFSWTPADHAQAWDRVHRISQKAEVVTFYQLFARGTIDEMMLKLLEKKQIIFDRLIEGRAEEEVKDGNIVSDLLEMVKADSAEIPPITKGKRKLSTVY